MKSALVIEREAVKNNIGVIKERAGEAADLRGAHRRRPGAGLVELARLLRRRASAASPSASPPRPPPAQGGLCEEEILMLRPTVDRASWSSSST